MTPLSFQFVPVRHECVSSSLITDFQEFQELKITPSRNQFYVDISSSTRLLIERDYYHSEWSRNMIR
ncbi:hypothetical protein V1478_005516 [Vespula squamosa]|uniref:Uncharacterized protein n=1 Tax=Vespula squamosa TaxID=30214 RepID=A0ABD2BF70_VESSQ